LKFLVYEVSPFMKFKLTTKICYANVSLLPVKPFATVPGLKECDSLWPDMSMRVLNQIGETLNIYC